MGPSWLAKWGSLKGTLKMKSAFIIVAILACGFTSASGQGKLLSKIR
jgi:hypothetical protein